MALFCIGHLRGVVPLKNSPIAGFFTEWESPRKKDKGCRTAARQPLSWIHGSPPETNRGRAHQDELRLFQWLNAAELRALLNLFRHFSVSLALDLLSGAMQRLVHLRCQSEA